MSSSLFSSVCHRTRYRCSQLANVMIRAGGDIQLPAPSSTIARRRPPDQTLASPACCSLPDTVCLRSEISPPAWDCDGYQGSSVLLGERFRRVYQPSQRRGSRFDAAQASHRQVQHEYRLFQPRTIPLLTLPSLYHSPGYCAFPVTMARPSTGQQTAYSCVDACRCNRWQQAQASQTGCRHEAWRVD
jgi:hypothetical protein